MNKIKFDVELKYDKVKPGLAVVYKVVLQSGKKELVIKYSIKE